MRTVSMTPLIRAALVASALFAAFVQPAAAQVGTTTQIITGHVTGPDSLPVNGARVDVTSVETGVVKHTQTRADGRFSLLFRDGGAQYSVKITSIGMVPATVTLSRQADEDRLVAEVRMGRTAVQLSAVQVRASGNNRPGAPGASNAGGSGVALPTQLLERLPLNVGDLASIAALAPGVIPTSATDSTPAGFSVAGQPPNQNNVTVDGSSFLFGSLPQDAVRSVRVVTNAYDVSRGQFTGGQIASTTKSGTADFQGTATVNRQQPSLQFPTSTSPTFGQKYTQTTGSFGLGGPIKGDQAFYFGSLQYDRKSDALASLLDASAGALANLGANADSVRRFLQLTARNGLGGPSVAPLSRTSSTTSALARLDWDLNESHSLMLRGDFRHLSQDATRIAPLALPQTGGSMHSDGGGAMATLTSSVGDFINEGRVYGSVDHQTAAAFLAAPLGVVTVTSDVAAGAATGGIASLQFGGNPGLPRAATNRLFEISDEVSWLAGTAHRVKLGALLNATRSTVGAVPNRYGTFLFNSLADYDAGRPALFARTLSGVDQSSGADNMALYLGDAFRHSATLQITYGIRAEVTRLPGAPVENPQVTRAFGHSTADWPSDFRVTPRAGFTYLIWNDAGLPTGSVRGGIGEFRGTVPSPLVGAVRNGSGLPGTQTNLLCVGSAVPTPDWPAYLADPGTIPTTCTGGGSSSFASTQPTVLLFDRGFGAPAVWRASLGFTRRLRETYSVGIDGLFAYGVNAAFGTDLNLPGANFALASEGGRPVYARPGDIVSSTGTIGGLTTRPHSEFGPVLSLGSGLKSRTGQITATASAPGFHAGISTVSYTFNRILDQSNGYALGSYLPNTAGDPNRNEWGTSDLERRHQLLATSFIPFSHGLEFSLIGRLLSGPRYTPSVNGDINGDGSRNDRAFVPTTGSGSTASDLSRLLAIADDRAAECIRSQMGQVASRNSCSTPWTPQLDMQVNWQPRAAVFDDRFTVSLVATNTLAGADRLLHGSQLRGWGQPVIPDRTLLTVTGFDPAARQYQYKVNTHFGTPVGAGSAFLVPFQIGLRGHVAIGTDPVKAQIKAVTGGVNGLPASVQVIKDRILKGVPYPVKSLLDQADSLGLNLTRDQRTKLTTINSVYSKQIDSVGDFVAGILVAAGPRPDLGALAPKLQSINVSVIKALTQSVKDAQATLSPEQWAKVPERIRLPLSAPPPAARPPKE
jgi:hypothetical protein